MTQHFIRKLARFEWLKRSYYRLYEPRVGCVVYGAIYTRPYSWQAGYNFFDLPRTIVDAVDNLMAAMGSPYHPSPRAGQ